MTSENDSSVKTGGRRRLEMRSPPFTSWHGPDLAIGSQEDTVPGMQTSSSAKEPTVAQEQLAARRRKVTGKSKSMAVTPSFIKTPSHQMKVFVSAPTVSFLDRGREKLKTGETEKYLSLN